MSEAMGNGDRRIDARAAILEPVWHGVATALLRPVRVPPLIPPSLVGLRYRAFRLRVEGESLAAWHIPAPGARTGVVLCHGYSDSRWQCLPLLRPLHEAGFHLLLFDHRAMGVSTGRLCTYGYREHRDVLAAANWLRREVGAARVGLFGISMGGAAVLLAAAADPTIPAVVADSAFARLDEMVERRFLWLPRPLREPTVRQVRQRAEARAGVSVEQVDPEGAVRSWRPRPLLVIHGGRDRLVPPEHAERLAAAGGGLAELWIVPDAPHAACHRKARAAYSERVTAFFRRHLNAA